MVTKAAWIPQPDSGPREWRLQPRLRGQVLFVTQTLDSLQAEKRVRLHLVKWAAPVEARVLGLGHSD